MINQNKIEYDDGLLLSLDFLCGKLKVSKKDFATLALANLLIEELDHLKDRSSKEDIELINEYQNDVKKVKVAIEGWVIE